MNIDRLLSSMSAAAEALLSQQQSDGHWCFELEADCTIPAEYILMMHYMDEIEPALEAKLASYIRSRQIPEGGWPLYTGGDVDISCTVKSYYALKLAGDDVNDEHMKLARQAVLDRGGAARANVFTRLLLAMFRQIPWRGTPFIPVEVMLFPRWFFFHLDKVAYWSRTVMVPLFILCSLRATARNPRGTDVQELFVTPPEQVRNWVLAESALARLFLILDTIGRRLEWMIPSRLRWKAIRKAEHWFIERLNGEDGLGAIFPAMVNAYEAMDLLGYPEGDPNRQVAKRALRRLVVEGEDMAYCQPCVSPVWDTCLACHALESVDPAGYEGEIKASLDWLRGRQVKDVKGDWAVNAPDTTPGGWAFQYNNDYYPDLDDTAAVAWAMDRAPNRADYADSLSRARDWLEDLQSTNGGYAAFDVDNVHFHLNEIPFADHGAMLDPPTADVTARCLAMLARDPGNRYRKNVDRCIDYLKAQQEPEGAWFGRWGTNYIYGTWSVLTALAEAGVDPGEPFIQKGVQWLKDVQRPDGGWGEDNDSYQVDGPSESCLSGNQGSTSYQTAWALLALIASGEAESDAVKRGVEYLLDTQNEDGLWSEPWFTAPGFPRVFYLKYHGYSKYFPLWALGEYRRVMAAPAEEVA